MTTLLSAVIFLFIVRPSLQFPGIIAENDLTEIINTTINLRYSKNFTEISYPEKLKFFNAFEIFNSSFYDYNFNYDFVKNETDRIKIENFLVHVENVNEKFRDLMSSDFGLENERKFFRVNLAHVEFERMKKSVNFVVQGIFEKSTPRKSGDLMNNVLETVVDNWKLEKPCRSSLSEQILSIYNLGARTVIQGNLLNVFHLKYWKNHAHWKINYKSRSEKIVQGYKEAILQISKTTKYFLRINNGVKHRIHGNCPPQKWELGSNYQKFTSIELKFRVNHHLHRDPLSFHRFPRVSTNFQCADIKNNEVVTGINFVMENNTLYPQIQVGKLENNTIDPSSVYWQPISVALTRDHTKVINVFFDETFFDIGGVKLSSDHFVTGVKFIMEDDSIKLAVAASRIDENLVISEPDWHEELNTEEDSVDFKELFDDDYAGDASFEPVFDIRGVVTDPPMPLGGLGIHSQLTKFHYKENNETVRVLSPYFVVYNYYHQFFSGDKISRFNSTVF